MSDLFLASAHSLRILLFAFAALGLLLAGLLIFCPRPLARLLRAFPRHTPTGWLLTAIAAAASTYIVYHAPLGRFDVIKPLVSVLGVVLFFAFVWSLRELLAVRALAACLLLAADPILDAILWAPENLLFTRNYATVLIYLILLLAALLFLYPWLYTRILRAFARTPLLRRLLIALLILLAILSPLTLLA